MARRKVNIKFLIIVSVVLVGVIGAAAAVSFGPVRALWRGRSGAKLIAEGDAKVKQADSAPTALEKKKLLEDAIKDYSTAANNETKNPELYLKLGDALSHLTQFDVYTYIAQSRSAWEKALEIDPRYMPALQRLEDSYYKEATLAGPGANTFSRLQERAKSIHDIDPKNVRAHALMNIAPLNQWLANIETPPSQIKSAIDELINLIAEHPEAPELPDMVYFVAGAKARQGIEFKRQTNERQGNVLIGEAISTFQNALQSQPNNASLHYRFFELLIYIRRQDAERDSQMKYTEMFKRELDTARKLAAPDNEDFVKINIAASEVAMSERDPKAAEATLKDLYKVKPDDQRVRLSLAKLWRYDREPAKKAQAIELLEQPMVDTGWTGIEALLKLDLELKSLGELDNMYIERYATLPEKDRPEELKRIKETYERLYSKARERADVLKIRGKIELLEGGNDAEVKAIQTFEKAQSLYMSQHNGMEDTDLTYLLARANLASHQYGSARTQLNKLKQIMPDFIPARMMLAQVLIREGDTKGARNEVDFLIAQAPKEPEFNKLLLAVLDQKKDAAKVKETYNLLPESNRIEVLTKAQIANLSPVSNPAEAMRLYNILLAHDAGDFDALQGAREVLTAQDKKDEAIKLFEAGQKAKPNDDRIALMIKQLKGQDVQAASEEMIRKQFANDPYGLELRLYEFHMVISSGYTSAEKKTDQEKAEAEKKAASEKAIAVKHLFAGEKLKPDDGKVQDMLFQYYLQERNWDKASEYVEKLAAKNFDQAKGLIYRYRLAMARDDIAAATGYAREMTVQLEQFARSWVFLGQALQAARQFDQAINAYNVALEKQSNNPEALAGNISCFFQKGQPTEALRFINRGLEAHPNNAYFKKQWESYQLSQWGDPSKLVGPALEDRDANPKDVNRWIALGRAQFSAAKKDKDSAKFIADAKSTFYEAIKRFPTERVLWAYLSEIADYSNDAAGGEAMLKDMMSRPEFKDSPEPAMMLADHYLRHNDIQKAEATMNQTLERFKSAKEGNEVRRRMAAYFTQAKRFDEALKLLDPGSPDPMIRQQIVEIYMLQGSIEKKPELFANAEKLIRSLLTSTPDDAQLNALLGVVLLNRNQNERARDALDTALKLEPKNQAALFTRAQLEMKEIPAQLDGAIRDLSTLRDIKPDHLEARLSLAEAFRQKRNIPAAIGELEYALGRAPLRKDIRMTLAGLYAADKPPQWAEAERIVSDAEKAEPKEPLWKRMLAKMWSTRELHEKAVVKIREALIANPQSAEILRDYFDILENAKMWQQLLAETNRVLEADKNMADHGWWVYINRAVARRKSGDTKGGMADFVKALEIVAADKNTNQDTQILIIDKIRTTMGVDDAIEQARQFAEVPGPKSTRWKVVLSYLYFHKKEYQRAAALIEEARAQSENLDNANQITAMDVAGKIYMMWAKYDKARIAYDQLLTRRPDDLAALNNLAFIMAEHTDPPDLNKALEYSQRAYDVMTKYNLKEPNVLDTYGWVNVLMGGAKLEAGIGYLNESIAAGEIPEAYYHMGEALLIKNLPDIAKQNFEHASDIIRRREANDKNVRDVVDENLKQKLETARQKLDKALGSAANP